MTANRHAPTLDSNPSGISGQAYSEDLDAEISALWNYVGVPITDVAGTANAIDASSSVPLVADPVEGQRIQLTPEDTNTGAVTIDVDERGALDVLDADGDALTAGEFKPGRRTTLEFDGTAWRILSPVAKQPWVTIRKASDEQKSSDATLGNDSDLQFEMEAGRTYSIRMMVFFAGPVSLGFKYALTGPSSPTMVRIERRSRAPNTTSYTVGADTDYTSSKSITGNANDHGSIAIDAVIENGSNAGTFAFQWAQDSAGSGLPAIVRKGSYLEWMVVA